MSPSPTLAAVPVLLALGCVPFQNPDATPRGDLSALARLEAASVRVVPIRAPRPLEAAVEALMGVGCRIIFTDPATGLVSFTTSRATMSRDTILEGTLRLTSVEEGVQVRLVLGGRTIWHGSEGDRTDAIARCNEALHVEFLDVVARGLRKP
jgi:hypothetical protein